MQNDDRVTAYRGALTSTQISELDAILVGHGEPPSSPYKIAPNIAYVCLNCGTIGGPESGKSEDRDDLVDNLDLRCCGLTVLFRSDLPVLVDPSKLVFNMQRSDAPWGP